MTTSKSKPKQEPQREVIMATVKSCLCCGYETNIRGDLARHKKLVHPKPWRSR